MTPTGPGVVPRPTHAVPSRLRKPEPAVEEPRACLKALRERIGDVGRSGAGRAAAAGVVVLVVLVGGHALTGWGADRTGGAQPLAVAATTPAGEDQPTPEETPAAEESPEVEDPPGSGPAPDPTADSDRAEPAGATDDAASTDALEAVPVPGLEPAGGEPELPGGLWGEVVDRLDAARAAALAEADPARLDAVYAEGSAALAADRAVVGELRAAGLSVRGARHELREVTLVEEAPGRARLLVVDVLPAHDVLGRDGQPVEQRPGRGARPVQLDLVDLGPEQGWRIAAVSGP